MTQTPGQIALRRRMDRIRDCFGQARQVRKTLAEQPPAEARPPALCNTP